MFCLPQDRPQLVPMTSKIPLKPVKKKSWKFFLLVWVKTKFPFCTKWDTHFIVSINVLLSLASLYICTGTHFYRRYFQIYLPLRIQGFMLCSRLSSWLNAPRSGGHGNSMQPWIDPQSLFKEFYTLLIKEENIWTAPLVWIELLSVFSIHKHHQAETISESVQIQTSVWQRWTNPPHNNSTTEEARLRAAGPNRRIVNFTETLNSRSSNCGFCSRTAWFIPPEQNSISPGSELLSRPFRPWIQRVYTYFKTRGFLAYAENKYMKLHEIRHSADIISNALMPVTDRLSSSHWRLRAR